ncbi:MAG: DNA primase family protein [Candidatus Asgardarchaeia archaeon]
MITDNEQKLFETYRDVYEHKKGKLDWDGINMCIKSCNGDNLKGIKEYIHTMESQEVYDEIEKEVKKICDEEEKSKPVDNNRFLKLNTKGKVIGVNIDEVVDYLLDKYSFRTIYWAQKGELIYIYKDGIWINEGRRKIEREIELILNKYSKTNIVNEIINKIKRKTNIALEDFEKLPDDMICLKNGNLNMITNEFSEHTDKFYFKSKIPIIYDPKAECPTFKKFIKETLYPKDIIPMQEWFGFCIYPEYKFKKATVLYGKPDTGKTTFLNIMVAFVGERNISGLSLQKISIGKSFDLLKLKDKFINIHDDLSDKDIKSLGGFKVATGGGWIDAEIKFGDHINIKSYAKLMFATNKIPPVKDPDDKAYWNRWMPFPFDNVVSLKEQDRKLETKCIKELPGILNWALEGFNRLIENNKFLYPRDITEVKQIMQYSSNILVAFSQECLMKGNEKDIISKENMYILYSKWCEINKKTRGTKDQLGKQLTIFVPYIIDAKTGSKGRFWRNVKIVKEATSLIKGSAETPLKIILRERKNEKDNVSIDFLKDVSDVTNNKDNFVILPESKQDIGKCSYCGKISLLKYKDNQGNYACVACSGMEVKK